MKNMKMGEQPIYQTKKWKTYQMNIFLVSLAMIRQYRRQNGTYIIPKNNKKPLSNRPNDSSNLVNNGIVPLILDKEEDYEDIDMMDE